jgi:hypothetical protein
MIEHGRLAAARASILRIADTGSCEGLCAPCVELLAVTGAAVSTFGDTVPLGTVCASDAVAARVDELQLDLGEGPSWQAMKTGRPVLVPVLRDIAQPSWPLFAAAVRECSAEAFYAFPLRAAGIDVGALDLYRSEPGPLGEVAAAHAVALARTLATIVLRRLVDEAAESDPDALQAGSISARSEVHQATGMVLAQVGTTASGAFALLRARAFTENRSINQVARDVVARRVRFDDPV